MKNTHQIFLISDSTGETLDRIFMALKAQFNNFNYELNQFSFTTNSYIIQPRFIVFKVNYDLTAITGSSKEKKKK
mgnify:CR=1 FL=1